MKKTVSILFVMILAVLLAGPASAATVEKAMASVVSFEGVAEVGMAGSSDWKAALAGMELQESSIIRTGADGLVVIQFTEGEMITSVSENSKVSLKDLLLKARLEAVRGKVVAPFPDAGQTKMQVTPLTGVRGTDQAESKAEDPKRPHYWEENVEGQ